MQNESSKKLTPQKLIVWVAGLVVVALAVGFFIFSERASAPSDVEGDVAGVLPEGVEVVKNGEKEIISNQKRNYEVTTDGDWQVSSSDNSLIIDNLKNKKAGASGAGGEGCRIVISETLIEKLDLFVQNKCDGDADCTDYKIETVNEQISSVIFSGSFMGSGEKEFYLSPGTLLHTYDRLTLVCSDEIERAKYEQQILSSFRRGK